MIASIYFVPTKYRHHSTCSNLIQSSNSTVRKYFYPHFSEEEPKAQRALITYLSIYSYQAVTLRLEASGPDSRLHHHHVMWLPRSHGTQGLAWSIILDAKSSLQGPMLTLGLHMAPNCPPGLLCAWHCARYWECKNEEPTGP